MSNLFRDLNFVREYIDDLLITSNGTLDDYLTKVEQVLQRLHKAGLKVNANKSKFCRKEVEYLGYLVTREGIKPQAKKVQAIHNMATPQTRKELRSFLGLVNHYRDMAIRRSHIIAPLKKLTSKKVPSLRKTNFSLATTIVICGKRSKNRFTIHFPLTILSFHLFCHDIFSGMGVCLQKFSR